MIEESKRNPGVELLDVVVSITAWNVRDLLRQCLLSIFGSPPSLSYQVVVVDDHSPDGTSEMVRQEFPAVDLVVSSENLGFIRANNLVLCRFAGRARYYLLLNADTIVRPGALDELVKFLDHHPEVGIVGGKLTKPDGVLDWACKRNFPTPSIFFYRGLGLDRLFPNSRRFGKYQMRYIHEDQPCEVESVCGALLLIRAKTVQQVGLMDEELFMYGDDLDWCYRAKRAGWKVMYYPRAEVIHYKSQSAQKRSYLMIYWWYKSTWIIYRKNLGSRYPFLVNWAVWGGLHTACALSLGLNFLRSEKRLPSHR